MNYRREDEEMHLYALVELLVIDSSDEHGYNVEGENNYLLTPQHS